MLWNKVFKRGTSVNVQSRFLDRGVVPSSESVTEMVSFEAGAGLESVADEQEKTARTRKSRR